MGLYHVSLGWIPSLFLNFHFQAEGEFTLFMIFHENSHYRNGNSQTISSVDQAAPYHMK